MEDSSSSLYDKHPVFLAPLWYFLPFYAANTRRCKLVCCAIGFSCIPPARFWAIHLLHPSVVRQMRTEAWDRWKVASAIAAIGALLELALTLFLVGLAVFVSTFQITALTVIVTVVIGFSLVCAFVATILPIYFRLCPYRTPASWLFVRLAELRMWVSSRARRAGASGRRGPLDWRTREIQTISDTPPSSSGPYNRDDVIIHGDKLSVSYSTFRDRSIVELDLLIRALSWVRQGSDDDTFVSSISECAQSVHGRADPELASHRPEFFTSINTLGQLYKWDYCNNYRNLRDWLWSHCCYDLKGSHPLNRQIRSFAFVVAAFSTSVGPYFIDAGNGDANAPEGFNREEVVSQLVARKVVFKELTWHISEYILRIPDAKREPRDRIVTILCLLRCTPIRCIEEDLAGEDIQEWSEALQDAFRQLSSHAYAYYDGLVPMILELLTFMGDITLSFKGEDDTIRTHPNVTVKLWDSRRTTIGAAYFAKVAVHVFKTLEETNAWEDGRHLFVMAANSAFVQWQDRERWSEVEDPPAMAALLSCIIQTIRMSSEQRVENCGAYVELPWLKSLQALYRSARNTHGYGGPTDNVGPYFAGPFSIRHTPLGRSDDLLHEFATFLSLMREGIATNLFTGEQIDRDLEELTWLLKNPSLPTTQVHGPFPWQRAQDLGLPPSRIGTIARRRSVSQTAESISTQDSGEDSLPHVPPAEIENDCNTPSVITLSPGDDVDESTTSLIAGLSEDSFDRFANDETIPLSIMDRASSALTPTPAFYSLANARSRQHPSNIQRPQSAPNTQPTEHLARETRSVPSNNSGDGIARDNEGTRSSQDFIDRRPSDSERKFQAQNSSPFDITSTTQSHRDGAAHDISFAVRPAQGGGEGV